DRGAEATVEKVDGVELVVEERRDGARHDRPRELDRCHADSTRPLVTDRECAALVEVESLAADDPEGGRPSSVGARDEGLAATDQIGVEAAAKAAVRRDEQQQHARL